MELIKIPVSGSQNRIKTRIHVCQYDKIPAELTRRMRATHHRGSRLRVRAFPRFPKESNQPIVILGTWALNVGNCGQIVAKAGGN